MRKFGLAVVGLICAGALLTVPAALAAKAKTAKDQVTLATDLKVGATVLKAGEYEVKSDGTKITFQALYRSVDDNASVVDSKVKPVSVPCSTAALPKKADHTQLDTTSDGSGGQVLKGVTIRGSEVVYNVTN